MLRAVLFLLFVAMLAGCTQGPSEEAGFAIRIVVGEGTYYGGDEVPMRIQATAVPEAVSWDFGDGTTGNGTSVLHTYLAGGTFQIRARALADGQVADATTDITIEDLFGGTGPVVPLPTGDDSGIVHVALPEGEPTVGDPVVLELSGPSFLDGDGQWTVFAPDGTHQGEFASIPARMEVPTTSAGRQQWLWGADIGNESFTGTVVFDVWGEPIEFGEPTADQWLRPGVHSEVCTVNFLFHYKWYRFFIGSAAHCVDGLDINEVCASKPTGKIGKKETLSAHDASLSTKDAWVAYESWITMDRVGTSDSGVCDGNDFALFELGPDAQKHMHPKALGFGGPTALAEEGYGTGTTLYGYGASNLHGNVGVGYPGQEDVNSKRGTSLGTDNAGYSQHLYFAIPGVPGDSGGPAFGPGGEALGAASTVTLTPTTGSNRYTVIGKALDFMEEHEGWRPDLITHDDFSSV